MMLQLLYTRQGIECIFLCLPNLQLDQPNDLAFLLCCFKSLRTFWRQQSIVYFGEACKVQYQKTDISKRAWHSRQKFKLSLGYHETQLSKTFKLRLIDIARGLVLSLGLSSRNFVERSDMNITFQWFNKT